MNHPCVVHRPSPSVESINAAPENNTIRILLIEDDEDDYFLTVDILNQVGNAHYKIVWAPNFEVAAERLESGAFDCCLVDYHCGGRTGLDFVDEMKRRGIDAPMILLTGVGDRNIDVAAMRAGAADYFEKGQLTPTLLERAIRYAINQATTLRELRNHSQLLATTLDNTDAAIATLGPDLVVMSSNSRFVDFLRSLGAIDSPEDNADADALTLHVDRLLSLYAPHDDDIIEIASEDGRTFELRRRPIEGGCCVLVAFDVTKHKLLESTMARAKWEAETASRAKSQFLANISHELRTPLNAVIGFSQVILDETFGPIGNERYAGYVRDIHLSGEHLLEVINSVLDLSKIEAERYDLRLTEVDIREVLEFCLGNIRRRADTQKLEIAAWVNDAIDTIVADEVAMRRILINLLSNAIKFTPAGGSVDIRVDLTANGGVSIAVRDTGIGMDARQIDIALEPFGQADNELNRRYEGTGLGLPLVRSLASLQRAEMAIESQPGVGTTILLTFPPDLVIPSRPAPRRS